MTANMKTVGKVAKAALNAVEILEVGEIFTVPNLISDFIWSKLNWNEGEKGHVGQIFYREAIANKLAELYDGSVTPVKYRKI